MKALLVLVFFTLTVSAQRAELRTGSVSGTVVCTDTNLPGRLTNISLTPVREAAQSLDAKAGKQQSMVSLYQTRLNGTFLIPRVAPGRYYVVAQKAGYLSAASLYTKAQIDKPATPELVREIAANIPSILVAAGQTSTIQLALHRAASVSGTLRFDDGSPASTLNVNFERRDPAGKWVRVSLPSGSQADDLGHFHAGSLPAGEYRMSTSLNRYSVQVDSVFSGSGGGMAMYNGASISIFLGDTFFQKDAKLLKLDDGQDASADMIIPLSRLHSVSGSLVEARTGKILNAGTVEFLEPGTSEVITLVEIDPDDPTFRSDYIPEGELMVRVRNARLVTRVPIPLPEGSWGTPQYKESVLQTCNPYEGSLSVHTDLQAVNMPMTLREQQPK